ncbi:MAG: cupin domain-containing protein [Acidobacteriota bacterium]|nr:cupin domain-containing protein [Acidobacteriota bacterium]
MRLTLPICISLMSLATAQTPKDATSHKMDAKAILLTPSDLKWSPAPAESGLPSAVQLTVLSGDPFKPGLFSLRLKIPDGGAVAAHWHPTDEFVTVIQGTFAAGMGDKLEASALHEFPTGSYIVMPKRMHHFASAKGETIVQIEAMGPFAINYVNAADDPRKK